MSDALGVVSRRLGPAFDLLALDPLAFVFERGGLGVATGSAAVLGGPHIPDLARTATRLLRIHEGAPSETRPFVAAALPFRPSEMCQLLLARRWVRRTQPGDTWLLEASSEGSPTDAFHPQAVAGPRPRDPFNDVQLTSHPSPQGYRQSVADAVSRIRSGGLQKVVLARTLEVRAGRPLDAKRLAHRLRAVDPQAYTFIVPTSVLDTETENRPKHVHTLVGASPELLVSRRGLEVRSNPLAGSAPRSGDPEEDRANASALVASPKDREEHAIVVDAVAETLEPFCAQLAWDPEPVPLETPNVWHLSTRFRGMLREPAPSALDLVAALHPTPAVAGTPRDVALDVIDELEPFDRGRYAGPVGWMDADGDGEWALALRCADLQGDRAVLYAGAGIVADSEPERELDETERKFRAFLDSLRWG
jgi:isochorismate synthase